MPGIGVHSGYHPVFRDAARNPEHPVPACHQVLPQHRGQQPGRVLDNLDELASVQDRQHRVPVARPGGDQRLTGVRVVPVDLRLARRDVVVAARQHRP